MNQTAEHAEQRIERELIERETAALVLLRRGEAILTVAKALLGMELILICFVIVGLRVGSHLFLWWCIAEGLTGLILVWISLEKKSEAKTMLKALEQR